MKKANDVKVSRYLFFNIGNAKMIQIMSIKIFERLMKVNIQ